MPAPSQWNPYLRFPIVSLLLTLGLLFPVFQTWLTFQVNSEAEVLLEGDQRNLSSYEKLKQIMKQEVVVLISMEADNIFSPDTMEAMHRLGEAFFRLPKESGMVDVKSLTHSYKPVRRGFNFAMVPFVPDFSPETLQKVKEFSLNHPLVRNILVSKDGRHSAITVTYNRDLSTPEKQRAFKEETEQVLAPFREQGYQFQLISFPFIEHEIRSSLYRDIYKFLPAAGLLLVIILWFTFRSWKLFFLLVLSQAILVGIIPGLVAWTGFELNVFNAMLFPLLTGMHLTLLIHVFNAFQRASHSEATFDLAISKGLGQVFKSCSFSALTTVIALLSLATCDVKQVRDFGLLGAAGMGVVFFLTFGPDLALLKLAFRRRRTAEPDPAWARKEFRLNRSSSWLTGLVLNHRNKILAASLAVLLVTAWGLTLLRTDIRAVEFLSQESETRQAAEKLDRLYGGINFVQIEFDSGATNGVNRLAFLQYLQKVHEFAESQPSVSSVFSYANFLAMMNQIWEGEKPGSFRLPGNDLVINLFVTALKSQEFPFMDALADANFKKAFLVLRTQDMPVEDYLGLINKVVDFARENRPENVSVSASEGVHSILEADRRIIRGQLSSALLTAGVIGMVLSLLWRSPVFGIISLVSNVIPVLFILALSGFADLPLNSVTLMLGAIVLGIAMDDSVHFITHWRDKMKNNQTFSTALEETFRVKSLPILATSLILIGIFSLFWLSSFPPIVHFGILAAVAFVCAQITVFTFLPAALHWVCGRKEKVEWDKTRRGTERGTEAETG